MQGRDSLNPLKIESRLLLISSSPYPLISAEMYPRLRGKFFETSGISVFLILLFPTIPLLQAPLLFPPSPSAVHGRFFFATVEHAKETIFCIVELRPLGLSRRIFPSLLSTRKKGERKHSSKRRRVAVLRQGVVVAVRAVAFGSGLSKNNHAEAPHALRGAYAGRG